VRVGLDNRLVEYGAGGTATYAQQLVREYASIGADHQFYVLYNRHAAGADLLGPNFHPARIRTIPKHRVEQWTFPLELARLRLDVLHSPDFIPPLRLRTFASVITIHDLAFMHFPEIHDELGKRYYGQLDRAVRVAERIIAVSESTAADVRTLLRPDPGRLHVVYEAVDPFFMGVDAERDAEELAASRAELGLEERFILFVGTIEPRKNIPMLIRAYAGLRERLRESAPPLVLAGPRGWLADEVYRLVTAHDLAGVIGFTGRVSKRRLRALYGAATIVVLPSLYEGFGLTALEAMACGAPVLASGNGAVGEVAGDAAVYADARDPAAWTDAMEELLGNEVRRRAVIDAGSRRVGMFSWERAARETLDIYRLAAEDAA
jgi:glycosyltransferase involved in cell wall biosynthesis